MLCQSTVDSYSELIRTTLEHYRRGYAKSITLEKSGDLFRQKLQALIATRLPLIDQLLMRGFENARTRGLMAARRGDLMTAERAFAEVRTPLQLGQLSLEGSLLYKSFLEQAEAYLDYCRGDFDQARNRTSEALAIDTDLEEDYGYEILIIHRIQLVHNLARIDARCMCFERAIELAFQILSYLEGASEFLPIPGLWGCERVARQSPELVTMMFAQVTSEVALILAGKKRQLAHDLFAFASAYMQLQANGHCHCHPRTHAWFLVKEAFVGNDVATFLERASYFLAEGRADTPLLWYATVIDLVALCDELELPDSKLVKWEIARDAVRWEYLPQPFFPLLGIQPKAVS